MLKRELARNPAMRSENWERFLPKFKKRNVKRRKPKKVTKKAEENVFPPPQQPRKVDVELETGEYFLKQTERRQARLEKRLEREAEAATQRRIERERAFEPPKETERPRASELNADVAGSSNSKVNLRNEVATLKRKLKGFKSKSSD